MGPTSNARKRAEAGFSLVELMAAVAIIGALSAVVVFSVQGLGDKGAAEAIETDERIIRVAQRAHCSRFDRYGDMKELVQHGFLSEPSEYHTVATSASPPSAGSRPCGGPAEPKRYYSLTCTAGDACPDEVAAITTTTTTEPTGPVGSFSLANAPAFKVTSSSALGDGKVLAVEDDPSAASCTDLDGCTNSLKAEVYDPQLDDWTPVAPPQEGDESFFQTTLGADCAAHCGKALVGFRHRFHWELYDPASDTWQPTGPSVVERNKGGTAVVISGTDCEQHCGKVLVVGGFNNFGPSDPALEAAERKSAEIWDPATNGWSATAELNVGREGAALAALPSGKVLAIGGDEPTTAEVYDPVLDTWSLVAAPAGGLAYRDGTATVLGNGKVLLASGCTSCDGTEPYDAQLYDPASNSWQGAGKCTCNASAAARRLADGTVLVISTSSGPPGIGRLYDPATDSWRETPIPDTWGVTHLVQLGNNCGDSCGKVLLAGSETPTNYVGKAELYTSG